MLRSPFRRRRGSCIAHGGGFLPYYAGRVDRAYEARPETRENIKAKPSVYMRRFYYDTTVYNPDMIEFEHANFETLGTSGAAKVAVGGGAPDTIPNVRFPPDCVAKVESCGAINFSRKHQTTNNH